MPHDDRPLNPVSNLFGHLVPTGKDPRTPEERAADEQRERNRRAGRYRKDWWKDWED